MSKKSKEESIGWLIPTIILVFVFIAWGATWFTLHDNSQRGTFGDMFGVINALFSGLAFGGVIYAILLQRKELQLQRKELQLTRGELQGQREQMKTQNSTLKQQNFEATFFQLLRLHNDITNAIDLVNRSNKVTKGRDCFKVFYNRYKELWENKGSENNKLKERSKINKTYLEFYSSHQSEFGHYFRSLYNIIKLIDNTELEDKRLYTNLVRAQLSSYELLLLFYNTLSDMGNEKFKPLVEEYSLLKTLPKNELINEQDHWLLFNPIAYGD